MVRFSSAVLAGALAAGLPFSGALAAGDPIAALGAIRGNAPALEAAARSAQQHGDPGTAAVALYLAYQKDPVSARAPFIASVAPNGPVYAAYMTAMQDHLMDSELAPYEALRALARGGNGAARMRLADVRAHADGEVGEYLSSDSNGAAAPAAPPMHSPFAHVTLGSMLRSAAPLIVGAPDHSGSADVRVRGTDIEGNVLVGGSPPSGRLTDGTWVSVLPISAGGSGGSFGALVWAWMSGGPHYAGTIQAPNGGLDAAVANGVIVARYAGVANANGPGPTIVSRYRIHNGSLLRL
jgi:hypothetical protein